MARPVVDKRSVRDQLRSTWLAGIAVGAHRKERSALGDLDAERKRAWQVLIDGRD